jgi:hypothetical protein
MPKNTGGGAERGWVEAVWEHSLNCDHMAVWVAQSDCQLWRSTVLTGELLPDDTTVRHTGV